MPAILAFGILHPQRIRGMLGAPRVAGPSTRHMGNPILTPTGTGSRVAQGV
jgi:hypothetical protein